MNLSKTLWISVGVLSIGLVSLIGYVFLVREDLDPKVTQVQIGVEESKFEEEKDHTIIKTESGDKSTTRKVNVGGVVSFDLPVGFKYVDYEEYLKSMGVVDYSFSRSNGDYAEIIPMSEMSGYNSSDYHISVLVMRDEGLEFNRIKSLAVDGNTILKKEKVVLNKQEGYLLLNSSEATNKHSVSFVKLTGDTTVSILWKLLGDDVGIFDQIRTNTLPKDSPYYTVLNSLTFTSVAQPVPKVDWRAKWITLIREEYKTSENISEVVEIGDVTGDGIPEAVVRYTRKGQDLNSTSSTIMMTIYKLENGKPTGSIFKSETLDNRSASFVAGFAGEPGLGAIGGTLKLLLDKQAFYSGGFSKSGSLISEDNCGVTVYKWNSQIDLFEEEKSLRVQFELPYCQGVEQKLKNNGF